MRKVLFWTHLVAGVAAGLVIFIMSVTGALLGFERQTLAWLDHRTLPAIQSNGAPPQPAEDILAAASRAGLGSPTALTVRSDPAAPYEAVFGRETTLFVNPYSGALLGQGSTGGRSFFAAVESLHRWVGAKAASRPFGRSVTGASNLLFLLVLVTGPFIWWPRQWNRQTLRRIALFQGGLHGKPRDWNWHNVLGIWCAVPLFLMVLTAVVMSYGWANDLLYRMTGTVPPVLEGRPEARGGRPPRGDRPPGQERRWTGLESLLAKARQQSPGWKSIGIRLVPPSAGVAFTIDNGSGGQPDRRAQLVLDRKTGDTLRWEPFSANNAGRKLRLLARFVHTGEAGGLAGQVIATVASACGAVLVWTGIALALRRFFSWRSRRARKVSAELTTAN